MPTSYYWMNIKRENVFQVSKNSLTNALRTHPARMSSLSVWQLKWFFLLLMLCICKEKIHFSFLCRVPYTIERRFLKVEFIQVLVIIITLRTSTGLSSWLYKPFSGFSPLYWHFCWISLRIWNSDFNVSLFHSCLLKIDFKKEVKMMENKLDCLSMSNSHLVGTGSFLTPRSRV